MALEGIDHVGVLVDDIEEARTFLGETLGLELVREATPAELGVHALFYRCGGAMIEAFQLIDPSSVIRPLELGQRARIDHIAIEVDDLRGTLEALAGMGVRPGPAGVGAAASPEPLAVAGNLNVWTDADSTDGVVYQLIQKGAG